MLHVYQVEGEMLITIVNIDDTVRKVIETYGAVEVRESPIRLEAAFIDYLGEVARRIYSLPQTRTSHESDHLEGSTQNYKVGSSHSTWNVWWNALSLAAGMADRGSFILAGHIYYFRELSTANDHGVSYCWPDNRIVADDS